MYQLIDLEIASGTKKKPTATVRMKINGEEKEITTSGDGPVDAVYKAITELTGSKAELNKFEIKAITGGTDALGEVTVILEEGGHTVRGHGSDTDIIVASAKAYINALNKLALRNLKA